MSKLVPARPSVSYLAMAICEGDVASISGMPR
jgi:hypothetical protein